MRVIRQIVLHHTATAATATLDDIRRMHVARGFRDVGYHYLLRRDHLGLVEQLHGRPVEQAGAHAKGHNAYSIGVSMVGNYDNNPLPGTMLDAAASLLAYLCDAHDLPASAVVGHRELAATACPGRYVDMDLVRERVAELLEKP